ncbi:hypothetical protein SDC9_182439 [bioreactor metagenome]|uniref:Uncharacterized protein n=1 Tax=bioreactor metagenome TaxID=1076179 RepID=A0A645H7G3_9ZZZZ
MKTQTSLVWANGIVELNSVTKIHLHFPFIIDPWHLKCKDTIRLNKAFGNFGLFKLGMLIVHINNGTQHFPNCL